MRLSNHYRGNIDVKEWYDSTGIVYVVYHTKPSNVYVGETSKTVTERFAGHVYGRNSRTASVLSQFLYERLLVDPDAWQEFRLFVIARCESDSQRKQTESNTIGLLRKKIGRVINVQNVPAGRRLRHRPLEVKEPTGPNILARVQALKPVFATIKHLKELVHADRVIALEQMSLRTLIRVRRALPRGDAMASSVAQTIAGRRSTSTTDTSVLVFPQHSQG